MTEDPTSAPPRADSYEDEDGCARLSVEAPGVVILRAEGRFTILHSSKMIAALNRTHGTIGFFVDFSGLLSYETGARTRATNWCKVNRERLAFLHILSKPGLVAMGVATAAMTLSLLGLSTKAYSDETLFAQAVHLAKKESYEFASS